MPLSSSCVLPREEALDLLDELRAALPLALEDAREVMAGREELLGAGQRTAGTGSPPTPGRRPSGVLAAARDAADRLLADARATAERMVSADGVRRAAEARPAASCRRPRTGRAGCGPTPTRTPTSGWPTSRTRWPGCSARSSAAASAPAARPADASLGSGRTARARPLRRTEPRLGDLGGRSGLGPLPPACPREVDPCHASERRCPPGRRPVSTPASPSCSTCASWAAARGRCVLSEPTVPAPAELGRRAWRRPRGRAADAGPAAGVGDRGRAGVRDGDRAGRPASAPAA